MEESGWENICAGVRLWGLWLTFLAAGNATLALQSQQPCPYTHMKQFAYHLRNPIDLDPKFIQVEYSCGIFNSWE